MTLAVLLARGSLVDIVQFKLIAAIFVYGRLIDAAYSPPSISLPTSLSPTPSPTAIFRIHMNLRDGCQYEYESKWGYLYCVFNSQMWQGGELADRLWYRTGREAWPVGNAIAIIIHICRLPSVKHFITTDFLAYRKSQFISSSALSLLLNNFSLA